MDESEAECRDTGMYVYVPLSGHWLGMEVEV